MYKWRKATADKIVINHIKADEIIVYQISENSS